MSHVTYDLNLTRVNVAPNARRVLSSFDGVGYLHSLIIEGLNGCHLVDLVKEVVYALELDVRCVTTSKQRHVWRHHHRIKRNVIAKYLVSDCSRN